MGKANCDIRIGTSGWHYDHWREKFYPADLPKSKWFEHYAEHFDTFELPTEANVAFCIHDMPGKESPHVVTSGTVYIRFHGTTGQYAGSYPKSALQKWTAWIEKHAKDAHTIYAYFNNDAHAHAIKNAKQLKELSC